MEDKQIKQIIRVCIKKGSIVWKEHILEQMRSRNISTKEIFRALESYKIIETYYEDNPFPSFLILGYTEENRPLHIVLGVNSEDNEIYFITAYQPNEKIWEQGFERRRSR